MTQYHFLDDSGDPGLGSDAGTSRHFVLAAVQFVERAPLSELAAVRQTFHLPAQFEFKYYKSKPRHKTLFFQVMRSVPFRVRAVIIDKTRLEKRWANMRGQDLTIDYTVSLVLRANPLDLASDVLIIDEATPSFIRALRLRLSKESRMLNRVRPFKNIIGANSNREDELQVADMIAGAIRHHALGDEKEYFPLFADKIVDLWEVPEQRK